MAAIRQWQHKIYSTFVERYRYLVRNVKCILYKIGKWKGNNKCILKLLKVTKLIEIARYSLTKRVFFIQNN